MVWKLAIGVGLAALLGLGAWWLLGSNGTEAGGSFELVGIYEIGTEEWRYGEMPVGEISGLAYDAAAGSYLAISDNRGDRGAAGKLYTLQIGISADGIDEVAVRDVLLLDASREEPGVQPHAENDIDAEEIVLLGDGSLLVSSERDLEDRPWIRRYSAEGEWIGDVELPPQFEVAEGHGVRRNLGIEAMCLAEDGRTLYAVNEQALVQDGPLADVEEGTLVRLTRFDLATQTPSAVAQYVYRTEPIFAVPVGGGYADNGVTAMVDAAGIDPRFDLLVLERAYVEGTGNDIRLFGVDLSGATDVSGIDALDGVREIARVAKTELLRWSADAAASAVPVPPDNMEAMVLGPKLADGRATLLLASDSNFNETQRNLFAAFATR